MTFSYETHRYCRNCGEWHLHEECRMRGQTAHCPECGLLVRSKPRMAKYRQKYTTTTIKVKEVQRN